METIISKKQMTEEDIKLNYITPALQSRGWKNKISMETKVQFTDGKINIRGNLVTRGNPKKADYILYFNANKPIAVVEAKDNNHSVSHGLQQAMEYAQMLDIPFAYSSNGDAFFEHDFLTGTERLIPLDKFPTYNELLFRYRNETSENRSEKITDAEMAMIQQPYYTSQSTYSPRYYQRIAINRTVEAIARGQKRLLLVMATGTGKTYTAFQIVYRLLQSDTVKKVLYLADRNILVDQTIQQDFRPLEKTIHKINFAKDDPAAITSYVVYFSLYQQLTGDSDSEDPDQEDETVSRLAALFKPDFFDLIIVDECHRGSAKQDSSWRKILEYFSNAIQLGMTATPKETKYVSNIDYFGVPVYTYSLNQGIQDGFLAPFRVHKITTDIGDGWRPFKGQLDIYGNEIEDRIYNNRDYDYNIILEDRTNQVAQKITDFLMKTDRMSKTIVFCANEDHAERMRIALSNLNADIVREHPDYVVRITGSDVYGKSKLKEFISVGAKYPVIATTSKLLSTGADCKMTKLIVLDQMINSMTEFKQIIGRGTRIREKEDKLFFTVMDFRRVSDLFADPDWDGPIEQDDDFGSGTSGGGLRPDSGGPNPPDGNDPKPYVDADGAPVKIINETVSVYDADGKLLRTENIIDYTRVNIIGEYGNLETFIEFWNATDKKKVIQHLLETRGIDLKTLKAEKGMSDMDDFDFICHIAYDQRPLTRRERANNVKKRDFFSKYSGTARDVLEALLEKYMNLGIYDIESTSVLSLDPLNQFGSPSKIIKAFGGKDEYFEAVRALEEAIYM